MDPHTDGFAYHIIDSVKSYLSISRRTEDAPGQRTTLNDSEKTHPHISNIEDQKRPKRHERREGAPRGSFLAYCDAS